MSQAENTNSTTLPEIPAGPAASISNPPIPRAALERAIEALVALLDVWDPEPDLEPNGDDEPSLGWTVEGKTFGNTGDDREPALSSSDMEDRYERYDHLSAQGLEHEHDGSEPSPGWQNEGSQKALRTSRDDCEEQCEDEGAQCEDEGAQDDREPDVDAEVQSWPNPMGPHVNRFGGRP